MSYNEGWKDSPIYKGSEFESASASKLDYAESIQEKLNYWWNRKRDFLIFSGNKGMGKTYTAWTFANLWMETMPFPHNFKVFLQECDIYSHLQPPYDSGFSPEYEMEKLQRIPFLVIDDFGTGKKSAFRDETLFAVINGRWTSRLPTIITTNLRRDALKEYCDDRVFSRLMDVRNTFMEIMGADRRQAEGRQ